MVLGVVKWYNPDKGYGFIQVEGREDVFVHRSEVEKAGLRLYEGDSIEFETRKTERGEQAINLKKA